MFFTLKLPKSNNFALVGTDLCLWLIKLSTQWHMKQLQSNNRDGFSVKVGGVICSFDKLKKFNPIKIGIV